MSVPSALNVFWSRLNDPEGSYSYTPRRRGPMPGVPGERQKSVTRQGYLSPSRPQPIAPKPSPSSADVIPSRARLSPQPLRMGYGPDTSRSELHSTLAVTETTSPALDHSLANPLDNSDLVVPFLSRSTAARVLRLYCDRLHYLLPSVDPWSVERDLARQRDREPGEGEWTAMLVVLTATTLLGDTEQLSGITRSDALDLVSQCYSYGQTFLGRLTSDFTVHRCESAVS